MEEFTFPRVPLEQRSSNTLPSPHLTSLSPRHEAGSVADTAVHERDHHRRSLSAVEPQAAGACSDCYTAAAGGGGCQRHGSARRAVAEDKMDLLWGDFNEELARAAAAPCPLTNKGAPWTATKEFAGGDETRRRAVVRRKRMGLLTMLRLLKKLFLAHKSGATARRRSKEAVGKSSL